MTWSVRHRRFGEYMYTAFGYFGGFRPFGRARWDQQQRRRMLCIPQVKPMTFTQGPCQEVGQRSPRERSPSNHYFHILFGDSYRRGQRVLQYRSISYRSRLGMHSTMRNPSDQRHPDNNSPHLNVARSGQAKVERVIQKCGRLSAAGEATLPITTGVGRPRLPTLQRARPYVCMTLAKGEGERMAFTGQMGYT